MYGVFKFYKDGCSDQKYIAIFEAESDAKQAVSRLEALRKDGQQDLLFGYCEGWEFRAYWTYEEVPKPVTLADFNTMVDQTLAEAADEFPNNEESDNDEEG